MEELITQINSLGLNEMTASLVGLAALSTSFHFIMGFITPIINRIKNTLYNAVVRELEVYVADPDFNKINIWIDENKRYTKLVRSFKIVTATGANESYDGDEERKSSANKLVAGFGVVWVLHPRYGLMAIVREKVENKNVYSQTETLKIRFFSLSDAKIKKFFKEVTSISDAAGPFVYEANDFASYWHNGGEPKEVYPPVGLAAREFVDDFENFLEKKSLYKSRNVPFKRGYLLHGEPGTGKTSIISHIAHKHSMNLYILSSSAISKFAQLSRNIKPNSIIVIEDIDFTVAGKKRRGVKNNSDNTDAMLELLQEGVIDSPYPSDGVKQLDEDNMQSFLNVLDGIKAFDGCIIIATTNKSPDDLDAALIRPGRLDRKLHIGLLNHIDQVDHINNFYGTSISPSTIPHQKPRTFADLQYICTLCINDVSDMIQYLSEEVTRE